jgi:hypothetical protein
MESMTVLAQALNAAQPTYKTATRIEDSASVANPLKRIYSVASIGSEESVEDAEHLHLCKRISKDLSNLRSSLVSSNLLINKTSPTTLDEVAQRLFAEFVEDMVLPKAYEYAHDSDIRTLLDDFNAVSALRAFLETESDTAGSSLQPILSFITDETEDAPHLEDPYGSGGGFWETIYVMHQEYIDQTTTEGS